MNNLAKAKSNAPSIAPRTAQTRSTKRLNLKASCLVGQCTFRSSAITSVKKANLDLLAGADLVRVFLGRFAIDYFVSR